MGFIFQADHISAFEKNPVKKKFFLGIPIFFFSYFFYDAGVLESTCRIFLLGFLIYRPTLYKM